MSILMGIYSLRSKVIVKGVIGISQTVIYGVAACTTALALIAISWNAIVHPIVTLGHVFEFTKTTFTAVLQS
jgi:hypothetical protein